MEGINPTEELSETLAEKGRAYDEFLSVTGFLKEAVETEEIDAVNRFIKQRDEIIRHINEIDRRIKRYWHSVPLDQRSAVIRRVTRVLDDLYGKLRRINAINQDCAAMAVRSCDALKKEMVSINQKKEGLQGYAGITQRIPKFVSVRT